MSEGADAPADELEAELRELHAEVDAAGGRLHDLHAGRLACRRGCSGCCEDGIRIFEVEARRVRGFAARLDGAAPASEGCAFLDRDGACRVYPVRPYVCRTQGLPLRWVEDDEVERRDVCELSEPALDLVQLPSEACHELGPFEARLASLQARLQGARPGAPLERVSLRSCFPSSEV